MTVTLVEEGTGEPIPCRIELKDVKGKGKQLKTREALYQGQWSIVDGEFVYRGKPGNYEFRATHGPEFAGGSGAFTLDKSGEGTDVVRLPRHANMAEEGWFAGDLLTQLSAKEIPLWLRAEGLQMCSVVSSAKQLAATAIKASEETESTKTTKTTKTTKATETTATTTAATTADETSKASATRTALPQERWYEHEAYFDDRAGSGLILHHWKPPAVVPATVPSARLLVMAKQSPATHAEIARLWAADAPIWLASGRIDSIQVLSEHVTCDGRTLIETSDMYHPEPAMFKGARGPGRLVENLYWQVLESGLRIPPSAGSGVGKSTSPLGYNRVYVALQPPLTKITDGPDVWWNALREGKSFITNGPLLRAQVNGQLPGHIFHVTGGPQARLTLNVGLSLTVADPVDYVDIIFNGDAVYHARLDEYAKAGGKIPPIEISESGWLVVRVVTGREETYRLASTAPYYVEFNGTQRISRKACQMFYDWLQQSSQQLRATQPALAENSQTFTNAALEFWKNRISQATCD